MKNKPKIQGIERNLNGIEVEALEKSDEGNNGIFVTR